MQSPAPAVAPAPVPVQYYQPQYGQQIAPAPALVGPSGSIGSLAPMANAPGNTAGSTMSKNDSHAVLMELFARDQDLVRQATESANLKAATSNDATSTEAQQVTSQHPMKIGSQPRFLAAVPSLNSWPHFSSITSLNNLGTMTGVKSITSMSGADLASQGNLNKMGNLAQVKSMESLSMGKNDSYAFLEVFFGDRSMSSTNMLGSNGRDHRGVKRERDEDNDVGLSLDEDAPTATGKSMENSPMLGTPLKDVAGDTGTLKRAYDDALAARGLISVSRSSERLTDLVLPAKMQKTLSQDFLRHHQTQAAQLQSPQQSQYGQQYMYSAPAPAAEAPVSQQYPGQHPQQQQASCVQQQHYQEGQGSVLSSDPCIANATVEVRSDAKCAICQGMCVDTQLRPCGHMFHERCLKPSLQTPMGQPKCPIDSIPIQSALLAVPADDNKTTAPVQPWNSNPGPASSNPFPATPAGTQSSMA
jgi:Zinc finger, C3HC4 type (RING finger)